MAIFTLYIHNSFSINMDQLNKIKTQEDPMANSWENDKMIITAEFAKMSRKLIAAGITCPTKAKETIKMNFKGDEIFRDVFPIIFNIELCKLKLKASNA